MQKEKRRKNLEKDFVDFPILEILGTTFTYFTFSSYLNSGIQALSNCPPLTSYFRTCGSKIPASKKYLLSHPYSVVMNSMWSGNFNNIAPSQLVSAIGGNSILSIPSNFFRCESYVPRMESTGL